MYVCMYVLCLCVIVYVCGGTNLIQLFGIIAGNQKENVGTDILCHGIVVTHHLTVVNKKFCIWHKFRDA